MCILEEPSLKRLPPAAVLLLTKAVLPRSLPILRAQHHTRLSLLRPLPMQTRGHGTARISRHHHHLLRWRRLACPPRCTTSHRVSRRAVLHWVFRHEMIHGMTQVRTRVLPTSLRTVAPRGLTLALVLFLLDNPVDMRKHLDHTRLHFKGQPQRKAQHWYRVPLVHLVSRLPREVTLAVRQKVEELPHSLLRLLGHHQNG